MSILCQRTTAHASIQYPLYLSALSEAGSPAELRDVAHLTHPSATVFRADCADR